MSLFASTIGMIIPLRWPVTVLLALVALPLARGLDSVFTPPSDEQCGLALGATSQESEIFQKFLIPDKDFPKIARPAPNDWLARHKEKGQSFMDYQLSHPNRPDAIRKVIYLQPLGEFPNGKSPPLGILREYASIFFQMEVKVLPLYDFGANEFSPRLNTFTRNLQINSMSVMVFLKKRLPEDAYCLIAITMADLYPQESWNYVFGQASLRERVGVYGFARHDPKFFGANRPEPQNEFIRLLLRRGCRTLAHEISHMFGLRHCIYYKCLVNGSNHLRESDAQPQHPCPICLRKLHDAISFDPVKRYRALETFYQKQGMTEEADWVSRQLAKVK